MMHLFDNRGRQIRLHGDLSSWWENGTEYRYQERVKCLIHQYSNFTEPLTNLKVAACSI